MSYERKLTYAIERDAHTLAQAVGTAKFWHEQYLVAAALTLQQHQTQIKAQAQQELAAIQSTYQAALSDAINRNQSFAESLAFAAAPWSDTDWQSWVPAAPQAIPRLTRIGQFVESGQWDSLTWPALLPIIGGRNLLFKAVGTGKERVRLALQSIMLRLLATLPPGKLRFICLDPVGLGSTMAGLIKGLPDILTGGQAWFDTFEIESRLAVLEKHIANVKLCKNMALWLRR